ncbi:G-protein coupled receptor 157-like [Mercenaria mercenaria]|uniref:G-protein coupled receptor 157-like n=1 Tax=Mercenaria mercenaria TaxID=6596 RepID=UPI00234F58CC|nr:G-protein coupled receptor 157-like [Mercenaria mercenaria]
MTGTTVTLATYNLVLTGTSSILSILGGIMIFFTYCKMREIRNFTRTLLVYLTLADVLVSVGHLIAVIRYSYVYNGIPKTENCTSNEATKFETTCIGQSFLTTFASLSSFLWTTVIAIHLWSSIVLKTRRTEKHSMHVLYHVICWIVPLTIVLVLLHKNYLGEDYCYGTGVWCGIKSNLPPREIEKWMYIADIGWQMACYLSTCFLYIHLKFYLVRKSLILESFTDRLRNEDVNFVFVWMVIYLLRLWGFTRFFITTYSDAKTLHKPRMKSFLNFLLLMQSYGDSGQGFWNFVLFCILDKTVRKHLKIWLRCYYEEEERERLLGDVSVNSQ